MTAEAPQPSARVYKTPINRAFEDAPERALDSDGQAQTA